MNESSLRIPIDDAEIIGNLAVPSAAFGLVVFAHGSGSGRHSSRNRFVAQELNRVNLATLLVDLLTEEEEISESATGHLRFDIGFLSNRLAAATRAVLNEDLPIGYFGASTGAAAALQASLQFPQAVQAIVSRG